MSISLRRFLTLCLAAVVSYAYCPRAVADGRVHVPTGDLVTSGRVLLDGAEAVSGVTFFSGSEVRTEEDAHAVLALGALGRAELLPRSSSRLGLGEREVSASLGEGGVRLSKPEGVAASVTTGGGSVLADPAGAAVFTVSYEGGRTAVETQSGRVRLRLGGKEVVVAAGERYAEGQVGEGAGNALTGRQRAGIILAVGGAVAAILIILAAVGDDDEEEPPVVSPSR